MKDGQEKTLPPSSNTGVEMTHENGLKLTVDWLEGTSKELNPDIVINDILKYPRDNFVPTEKGALGYMSGLRDGHIVVYFEGQEDMGVHFSLTGEGCRQYENELRNSENPLFDLMRLIDSKENVKLSRLDLAIDDFKGIFSIPGLVRKVKNGELISRFKKARKIEDILVKDGSTKGTTLYFGSPTSNIMVRMYEKNYQMEMENEIPNWNRTEIQLRDEKAMDALREICSGKPFGEVVLGILNYYIRFIDVPKEHRAAVKSGKKRKDRFPINKKWAEFIGGVEKLRLSVDPKEITLQDKFEHLMKQGSKAFVMLRDSGFLDEKTIFEMMSAGGRYKMKKSDYAIVDRYIREQFEVQKRIVEEWEGEQ